MIVTCVRETLAQFYEKVLLRPASYPMQIKGEHRQCSTAVDQHRAGRRTWIESIVALLAGREADHAGSCFAMLEDIKVS